MIHKKNIKYNRTVKIFSTALLSIALLASCSPPAGGGSEETTNPAQDTGWMITANETINVRDFGAVPNTAEPQGKKIKEAIDAAAAKGNGTRVLFEEGTYRIEPPADKTATYSFIIQNAENLIIEGKNTTLLFEDCYIGAFSFSGCKGVEIKGLTVDYVNEPWTQGTVLSTDPSAGKFIFKANADCCDLLSDPRAAEGKLGFGMVMDKDNPVLLKKTANDHFFMTKYEKTGDLTYEISIDKVYLNPNFIDSGDNIVITNRGYGGDAIAVYDSADIYIKDFTVYATPTTAVLASKGSGEFIVDNLQYLRKPGSGRWISGNADGVHFQGHRGAVTVENCVFEGMADDGINFYQVPSKLTAVKSDTQITLQHWYKSVEEGDALTFYDPKKCVILGQAKAVSVSGDAGALDVILDKSVADMGLKTYTDDQNPGTKVFNDAYAFDGSVIRDNIFREYRGIGMRCKTNNTTIEGNRFIRLSGVGIEAENIVTGYDEGLFVNNLLIKDNYFEDCAYMDKYLWYEDGGASQISVRIKNANSSVPKAFGPKNVVIENNTFVDYRSKYCIYAANVDGLTINNNSITARGSADYTAALTNMWGDKVKLSKFCPVKVVYSNNVTTDGNTVSDMRPEAGGRTIEVTEK